MFATDYSNVIVLSVLFAVIAVLSVVVAYFMKTVICAVCSENTVLDVYYGQPVAMPRDYRTPAGN